MYLNMIYTCFIFDLHCIFTHNLYVHNIFVFIYFYLRACIHTCVYIYTYLFIYCTYTHTYIYICTHIIYKECLKNDASDQVGIFPAKPNPPNDTVVDKMTRFWSDFTPLLWDFTVFFGDVKHKFRRCLIISSHLFSLKNATSPAKMGLYQNNRAPPILIV